MASMRRLGVPSLLRRLNRTKPGMLTYHGFVGQRGLGGVNSHLHLYAGELESQIRFLSERHTVVSVDDIVRHCDGALRLPDNALALSIDDGYRSIYDVAFPLLKRFSVHATVFLSTDFVDGREFLWHDRVGYCLDQAESETVELEVAGDSLRLDLSSPQAARLSKSALGAAIKNSSREDREGVLRALESETNRCLGESGPVPAYSAPLSWSQVNEMQDSGVVDFGSHTKTHSILTGCSDSDARTELDASKARIEGQTGRSCELFCYPNGTAADFSAATRQWVQRSGYRCGLTAVPGLISSDSDVFALPRFSSNAAPETLELKLAGLADLRARASR